MIIRRADTLPLRPATAGQTGSHYLDDASGHTDQCAPAAWRHSKYVSVALLCVHKRVVEATPSDLNLNTCRQLPYWAPLVRTPDPDERTDTTMASKRLIHLRSQLFHNTVAGMREFTRELVNDEPSAFPITPELAAEMLAAAERLVEALKLELQMNR